MEYLEKEYKDHWQAKQDNVKDFIMFAKSSSMRFAESAEHET
jgi:hypothetical protein